MIIKLKEPKDSRISSDFDGNTDVQYKWVYAGIRVRKAYFRTSVSAKGYLGEKHYLGNEVIVPYGNIMYVIMDEPSGSNENDNVEE